MLDFIYRWKAASCSNNNVSEFHLTEHQNMFNMLS